MDINMVSRGGKVGSVKQQNSVSVWQPLPQIMVADGDSGTYVSRSGKVVIFLANLEKCALLDQKPESGSLCGPIVLVAH
jgi:hypothetical protein